MLTVYEPKGIRTETRAAYMPAGGNQRCAVCGSLSTAAAPDFLLRQGRGWVWNFALAIGRKRYHRRKEGLCMTQPSDYATRLAKLPDRIAAIVGKTVVVRGDAFIVDDDEALERIRDLLDELDPTLIDRNKDKKIPTLIVEDKRLIPAKN